MEASDGGAKLDVSDIFGSNLVVFTAPPNGTFFLTLEYKNRSLTLPINGRNLYIMVGEHNKVRLRLIDTVKSQKRGIWSEMLCRLSIITVHWLLMVTLV